MIEINIPLPPVPWAPSRITKYNTYDPKAAEKRAARFSIQRQYDSWPLHEYVVLEFLFSFKPPASTSKKRKIQMLNGEIIPTRCDCTNLQKLYEDCLKNIVIRDDRNVAKIISEKIYAEKDNINIKIYELQEYNANHTGRS